MARTTFLGTIFGRLLSWIGMLLVMAGLADVVPRLYEQSTWETATARVAQVYDRCWAKACPTCRRQRTVCPVPGAAPPDGSIEVAKYMVLRFQTQQGRAIEVRPSASRMLLSSPAAGDAVRVRYRKTAPDKVFPASALEPAGSSGVALAMIYTGLGLLFLRLAARLLARISGARAGGHGSRGAARGPIASRPQSAATSSPWGHGSGHRQAPLTPAAPAASIAAPLPKRMPIVAVAMRSHRTGRARGLLG